MYNLILADDDRIVLDGLKKNIQWNEYGFSLCGMAVNGRQAIDMVKEFDVNVVLSDIFMPFFNGIEVAEHVRAIKPTIKVIILTGYDDFNYISDAFKNNVFDYMLKPVSTKKMINTLIRVKWELDNQQKIEQRISDSLPVLKQRFFQQLLDGAITKADVAEKSALLDISFPNPGFLVMAVHISNHKQEQSISGEEIRLVKYGVFTLVGDVFGENVWTCDGENDSFFLIANIHISDSEELSRIYQKAETLRVNVECYLKTTVTIGVGEVHESYLGIAESYKEALCALKFKNIYGENLVIFVQDTGKISGDNSHPLEVLSEFTVNFDESLEQLQNSLQNLQRKIVDAGCTDAGFIRFAFFSFMQDVCKRFNRNEPENVISYQQTLFEFYESLQRTDVAKIMLAAADKCLYNLFEIESCAKRGDREQLVNAAIDYLHRNYMQVGLKQSDVAKKLYVTAPYLSSIFKQITETNFSDYLLRLRITEAERLLKISNKKVYEVAREVGFINEHYFSSCYKRITGYPPSSKR